MIESSKSYNGGVMIDEKIISESFKKIEDNMLYRRCLHESKWDTRAKPPFDFDRNIKSRKGFKLPRLINEIVTRQTPEYTYREFSIKGLIEDENGNNKKAKLFNIAGLIEEMGIQIESHNLNIKNGEIVLFNDKADELSKKLEELGIKYNKKEGLDPNDRRSWKGYLVERY